MDWGWWNRRSLRLLGATVQASSLLRDISTIDIGRAVNDVADGR
jgi:hypothetical protein